MCGIAGIHQLTEPRPAPLETLRGMIATLRHRGPDEAGLYRDAWTGLASARLSIIDLSGGQQPLSSEDGRLWIVFNGEIFNYLELRDALVARGHRFATHSDTEVVVHLYEQYGPGCLSLLNGQFAIAIWDARERRLFLARDRFGIRPLFYTLHDGRLVFGSEIKAILACPGIQAQLDPAALRQVFTYWSTLSPGTVYRGIQEVPPGHYLLAQDGQVAVTRYWSLDFTPADPAQPAERCLEEFEHLLVDATRIRLRADVPVGAYLSGGLDSSVTAALIKGYTQAHLDTFSIAFSDEAYDERSYQQRMAAYLGTDHHEVYCTHADIAAVFPDVVWHAETPILRTAPAPMFLLSRLVREHGYKVVLTGEGADELLAGYDLFKEMKIRRFCAADPASQKRPLLFKRLYPDIAGLGRDRADGGRFLAAFFSKDLDRTASPVYSHWIRWSNTSRAWRFLAGPEAAGPLTLEAVEGQVALPDGFGKWSALAQAQYLEIATFLSPYLLSSQGDRMSLAHSVEGRYPFLDYRVAEFCGRLPDSFKLRGLYEKWLLRRLGRRLAPPEIWQRPKRPYRAPIRRSFFPPGRQPDYLEDLLSAAALRRTGYFQPGPVEKLLRKARGPIPLSEVEEMALVGILSTQLVDRHFVRGEGLKNTPALTGPLKVVDQVGE